MKHFNTQPLTSGIVATGKGSMSLFHYLRSGRWIVDFTRWLVTTGGNIAESAFLLATIYVTINYVAHLLLTWVLPESTIALLNQVSVIAFSVLPELIVIAAIKVTFDHWAMYFRTKHWACIIWAIAFTLPTIIFVVMTVLTLSSFVSVEAISTTSPQVTGWMLVTRCLAGWSYGTLQMLFVQIGRHTYTARFDAMALKQKESDIALSESAKALENSATALFEANEKIALLEGQLAQAKVALSRRSRSTAQHFQSATGNTTVPVKSATVTDINVKRETLKQHMKNAVMNAEKINVKNISKKAGVSYNMARKHVDTILEEISQELPTMSATI